MFRFVMDIITIEHAPRKIQDRIRVIFSPIHCSVVDFAKLRAMSIFINHKFILTCVWVVEVSML